MALQDQLPLFLTSTVLLTDEPCVFEQLPKSLPDALFRSAEWLNLDEDLAVLFLNPNIYKFLLHRHGGLFPILFDQIIEVTLLEFVVQGSRNVGLALNMETLSVLLCQTWEHNQKAVGPKSRARVISFLGYDPDKKP